MEIIFTVVLSDVFRFLKKKFRNIDHFGQKLDNFSKKILTFERLDRFSKTKAHFVAFFKGYRMRHKPNFYLL